MFEFLYFYIGSKKKKRSKNKKYCLKNEVQKPRRTTPRERDFPAFGQNTEKYGVSHRIESKCGKKRTGIIPNADLFYAVPELNKILSAVKLFVRNDVTSR